MSHLNGHNAISHHNRIMFAAHTKELNSGNQPLNDFD